MEPRDQERSYLPKPNFPALLVLCALVFIWTELRPLWMPCLTWLFSLLEPVSGFFSDVFPFLYVSFVMLMLAVGLAGAALLLGGGIPKSR